MAQLKFNPHRSGLLLSLGVAVAVIVTALVFAVTKKQRHISQQQIIANQIAELLPAEAYDNNPASDAIEINASVSRSLTVNTAYLYKTRESIDGAVLHVTTSQGYSGDIDLLIALNQDTYLHGVAITGHTETPGLGDKIEKNRSNWIKQFINLNTVNISEPARSVKKDGGKFDQITGATVTSRAVVSAVFDTISWYARNRELM